MKNIKLLLVCLLLSLTTAFAAGKIPAPYKIGFNIGLFSINADRIERARQAGIEYIEVGGIEALKKKQLSPEQMKETVLKIKELLDKNGMKVWSIHMPFRDGMDMALLDEAQRRQVVDRHLELMPYVALLKPQVMLFHPGGSNISAGNRQAQRAQFVKSAVELRDAAKQYGCIIVIENMLRKPKPEGMELTLCSSLEDMKVNIAALPQDIYVAIDVNHAERPQDYIAYFGERVRSLHISDCDKAGLSDCHFLPGKGTLDFVAILAALNQSAKYKGVFMYELGEANYNKDYSVLVDNYNGYYQQYIKTLK